MRNGDEKRWSQIVTTNGRTNQSQFVTGLKRKTDWREENIVEDNKQ